MACLSVVALLPAAGVGAGSDKAANPAEKANERTQQTPARPVLAGYDKVGSWHLAWSDEFDGDAINTEYWSHEVNCWGGGNNERQCYTDRPDNSYVADGLLHIVAKEEPFSGPAVQDDDPAYDRSDTSKTQNYTSARLRTKGKVDFTYGRVDVRAQVAGGQGMWPAIWMLPTDNVYGGWPSSGEIDIFEAVNLPTPGFDGWGNVIHGTLHYGLQWPQWENHGASRNLGATNPADGFHVYSVEWDADQIRWYVDGQHWQTQSYESWYNYVWGGQETGFAAANDRAPFDQDFHLLLNLAVGGDWPGNPDKGWVDDRKMLVDYVRVYQCPGTADGTRCAITNPDVAVNAGLPGPAVNSFGLYDGGVSTLSLHDDELGTVDNTPVPGQFVAPGGNVVSDPAGAEGWDVEFIQTGNLDWGVVGNVFLTSQHMDATGGNELALEGGTAWSNNGELEFDLKVNSIDPSTRLFVKIDSDYPQVGVVEITPPSIGEWTHVAVKVADLIANHGPDPVNTAMLNNLFVLEATGPADVVVDHIELQCAVNGEPEGWQIDTTCGIAPHIPDPFVNGDFSAGLDGWGTYVHFDATAGVAAPAGAAVIDVTLEGGNFWSIQLFQGTPVEAGDYRVRFDASSTEPRSILVVYEQDFEYYKFLNWQVELDSTTQTYEAVFNMPEARNGALKFLAGCEVISTSDFACAAAVGAPHQIVIDNVVFEAA